VANLWYPKFKAALLKNAVGYDLSSAGTNVRVVMIDLADYTYNAAHEFLSDAPVAARGSTTGPMGGKVVTNGLFAAGNPVFIAPSGDQSEAQIVYIDTGADATSRLVLFFDTFSSGAPYTPSGIDFAIHWNPSGIAQL
jgi:hypothetical protein